MTDPGHRRLVADHGHDVEPTAPVAPLPRSCTEPPPPAPDIDLTGDDADADASRATVVPHVVGHHIDLALRRLGTLGLTARVLTTEVHDKSDRHVVSTQPPAGTPAAVASVVEVVVGIAPTVADYLGHDADDAVRVAELAGHVVEAVPADPLAPRRTTDVVLVQEPDPGERSRVVLLRVGPPDGRPTT